MEGGMAPSQVIGKSREAEGKSAADKRDIVPLLGVPSDRSNHYEGQGGSSGDLGAELKPDRDLGSLDAGRRNLDSLRRSNTDCGP